MNRGTQFLITVIASAIVTALGNFIVLYYFGGGGIALDTALVRFVVPGLLYAAMISILLGRNAPLFSADFNGEGEKVFALLRKIGALPIKSIAYTVVLDVLFLWIVIFPLGSLWGFNPDIKGFLYTAGLAAGMAVGTLTYVIGDGLVSRSLMESRLVSYPRELRENRQGLKACVIPVAVVILAIGFTFSVTVLALTKAGLDFAAVTGGEWVGMIATLALLFAFVVILAMNLKINASALYNSIIIQLENLSSGKKDLKRRITITSVDELGLIAGMMNSFCETVASGMVDIKSEQSQLLFSGRELAVSAQGMDRAVGEISGKISNALEKTGAQMRSVDEASQAIRNITVSIESLSDSIDLQSRSVDQASSVVEEMVGNIASIGNVTEKMADHFKTVDSAARKGIDIQNENSGRVEIIVEQSKALQDANRIIASISAETNLLAMNAAIEAAHAGDVGRGFSVVAGEIRKLAENSAKESRKINDELKQIITTIDDIVKGTKLSADAFGDVSERVQETENLVYEVNNAIKEQRQGTEQILEALKQMNGITTKVKNGSVIMREGSAAMLKEIGSLQNQSRDISTGMESLTREINAITEGAGVVSKRAADTNGAAEKIEKAVNGFEV